MDIGILGLARSGKTSFFNAVTRGEAQIGAYSSQQEPNVGVARVPDDLVVEGFLGRYELTFRVEEDARRVVVRRRVDFHPIRIPPSEYPALLRFCRDVDERESERILVDPVPATPPAPRAIENVGATPASR